MNAQRLLSDGTITTLPFDIIENILWRLPTKDIVKSSILSKDWRYNWTNVPKVVFTEDLFCKSTDENPPNQRKKMSRRCRFFNAIYQFLLLHQGPIVDFTLDMNLYDRASDCFEVDQILLHLSRKNTVKKLHLSSWIELPTSIFSFHQLTHLYISDCGIYKSPTFNVYGSLTTLFLENVDIHKKTLMHILSNNPLLKSFTMLTGAESISNFDEHGTIDELFQSLPVIEHLILTVWDIEYFGSGVVPRNVASSLVHLRYFSLEEMCLYEDDWLRFLLLMMRSSPNLEKLTLKIPGSDETKESDYDLYYVTMQECSDIWLQHLIEFKIEDNFDTKHDLEFVKFILAKSPVLKKLKLCIYYKDADLKLLESLLSPPPASPIVQILGFRDGKDHPFEIDGVIY